LIELNGVLVHVVPWTVEAAIANVWIVAVDCIWVDEARTAAATVIAINAIGINGRPRNENLRILVIFVVRHGLLELQELCCSFIVGLRSRLTGGWILTGRRRFPVHSLLQLIGQQQKSRRRPG